MRYFEHWVIVEYKKNFCNRGEEAPIYYWRDKYGHDVELVIDEGSYLDLVEIKSGKTFQKEFLKNVNWLKKFQDRDVATCVYRRGRQGAIAHRKKRYGMLNRRRLRGCSDSRAKTL